jgi:4-hydroxy-tetrahydrodipicolinate reductase
MKGILIGASGRLGSEILSLNEKNFGIQWIAKITSQNSDEFLKHSKNADFILDVSLPKATTSFLKSLSKNGVSVPYLIGCTGLTASEWRQVKISSKKFPILYASNFSLGIRAFHWALKDLAPFFKKLGYDISISETHHIHKKDKPSGTAKSLAEKIERFPTKKIKSIREGSVIGIHEITFSGPEETFLLKHEAKDRKLFARGALEACKELMKLKKSGLYKLSDLKKL